ncbi:hypothetical protein Rhe02_19030 [Rhizocola hellebori]|uniref:Rv2525c-like glycoside hydrolase-like domain-containing protein n=1 Tax=Rhizocola hellebori TaxID=1392758 RepID=A0A8J3VF23_9ACTN|nr:DUF1906 domain-containing protein [Rhizocola hellebori]GIH03836.1 hypothetical protein Rhe02_19030 [Rhizocola hellebori]
MTSISRRTLLGAAGAAVLGSATAMSFATPALAAVRRGIDYSWGRPRPSAIAAAGYSFVCRYVSWSTTGKNLTRSEADALRAAGLDIVTNWEYEASEALGGYSAGVENATEANRQAIVCGMPSSRPIYFSVDWDASAAQQGTINAYFDGIASVIGRSRTGAYGGFNVIDRLFDAGKVTWGWQTYAWSGGNWDSRAELRQVQNGITVDGADCDRNEAHAADFGQWGGQPRGTASIYGALADGRLTYTAVDASTGTRTHGAVVSTATLGFVPKAMATLNFNTILVTNPGGQLYRVDVITNNESLVFNAPVLLGGGWTHDLLAFDGHGSLFGIAGNTLRRYTITAAKPAASNITSNTVIDSGFTLKTLTATGPGWILGTTTGGLLLSYKINGAGNWDRYELRSSTWQVFDNLLSPGGGVYFGHRPEGSMHQYVDASPYNGSGSDISGASVVDAAGWTQYLLSAQPATVS